MHKVVLVVFYNLLRLEPVFITFDRKYPKCMYNFPLHLNCVLTLPNDTVTIECACRLPLCMPINCAGLHKVF